MATIVVGGLSHQNEPNDPSSASPIQDGDAVLTGEKIPHVGAKPVDRHVAPLGIPGEERRFFFQRTKGYDPNAIATQVLKMYERLATQLTRISPAFMITLILPKTIYLEQIGMVFFFVFPIASVDARQGKPSPLRSLCPMDVGRGVQDSPQNRSADSYLYLPYVCGTGARPHQSKTSPE